MAKKLIVTHPKVIAPLLIRNSIIDFGSKIDSELI
jgi:hypothetical protein